MVQDFTSPVRSLDELIERRLGVKVVPQEGSVTSIGTTSVDVLDNNPGRVGAVIINLSSNAMYLRPLRAASSSAGIRLAPNGGGRILVWDEEFHSIGWNWQMVSAGGSSAIFVIEQIIER